MEKNSTYWLKFHSSEEILQWLNNFSNDEELYFALILANKIDYLTKDKIQYLWKLLLKNRAKLCISEKFFSDKSSREIEDLFPLFLKNNCIFMGFGTAGDSAQPMLYSFVKAQTDPNIEQWHKYDLAHFLSCYGQLKQEQWFKSIKVIFLIDDFIGGGNQALKFWRNKWGSKFSLENLQKENSKIIIFYLALAGTKEGRLKIETTVPIRVILGQELDEKFRCFSSESTIYDDSYERSKAKTVMEAKGRLLYDHPLGFNDGQLAIAFDHNTPNNSLPVIWKRKDDGNWFPLFERFGEG